MKRSGFAAITAIILMGFLAVALAALGRHLAHDARRTHEVRLRAQLRQLLHAGAVAATSQASQLAQQPSQVLPVASPPNLGEDATIELQATVPSGGVLNVTVKAALNAHPASQVLRFELMDGTWVLSAARLE